MFSARTVDRSRGKRMGASYKARFLGSHALEQERTSHLFVLHKALADISVGCFALSVECREWLQTQSDSQILIDTVNPYSCLPLSP